MFATTSRGGPAICSRTVPATLLAGAMLFATPGSAQQPATSDGVKVGKPSILRRLVSAERLERDAQLQFVQLKRTASQRRALVPANHPAAQRLRRIARALLPHTRKWNERAHKWQWEVELIASKNINAFCMPGGKIAFFSGLIDGLKLSDDEIAMVMGHEIAHALREHARERVAKTNITQIGGRVIGAIVFGQAGEALGAGASSLLTLKFSRDDEKEADLVGMEIAARAGYDPSSGIVLWQKMERAAKGAPPQWLSTHPASKTRIALIKKHLPEVMPLYERAKATRPPDGAPATLPTGRPIVRGDGRPAPHGKWNNPPGRSSRPVDDNDPASTVGSAPAAPPSAGVGSGASRTLPQQAPLPLPSSGRF